MYHGTPPQAVYMRGLTLVPYERCNEISSQPIPGDGFPVSARACPLTQQENSPAKGEDS